MSQMFGSVGGRKLTDKEIAEDILTGQKYMLNYYYAPAILEASANDLRSTFQHVHNNKQSEAKQVFDYLNSKGWYRVRQADNQTMNDLRNTAQEARQILASIGPSGGMMGQQTWTGTQAGEGQSGYGPSSLSQGARWGGQPSQMGSTYGASQWTGTQTGEGQSGYGPSSLSQGARWGGQPSQMGSTYGASQWTGTQAGEGQSGYGPSSLSQGARWGGQPSQMSSQTGSWSQRGQHAGVQESVTLPSWTRGSNISSESERSTF